MVTIDLPAADGGWHSLRLGPPGEWTDHPGGFTRREALAAAHVVADPRRDNTPGAPAEIDVGNALCAEMKVTCTSGMDISYTVQEVAADGATPQDHAWLTLNKTGGGPLSVGQSDIVQFTVDSYNQAVTGKVLFTPTCGTVTSGGFRNRPAIGAIPCQ